MSDFATYNLGLVIYGTSLSPGFLIYKTGRQVECPFSEMFGSEVFRIFQLLDFEIFVYTQ